MPRKKTGEEMNFTYVECLLYTFHHLAYKTPNATNSLCGYKIVTGKPSDRLGEDFSDIYKDFCERLTTIEDLARITMKKLKQGQPEHDKALEAAKTEEDKAIIRIKKQNTGTGLRTCNNILAMAQPLRSKSPPFIGEDKITLSWKPIAKSSEPSTTVGSGKKRAATGAGATVSNNAPNKRGQRDGGLQSPLEKQTSKAVHRGGGKGGASGRRLGGHDQGEGGMMDQFVSRSLKGLFRSGRSSGSLFLGGSGRGRGGFGRGRLPTSNSRFIFNLT